MPRDEDDDLYDEEFDFVDDDENPLDTFGQRLSGDENLEQVDQPPIPGGQAVERSLDIGEQAL